MSLPPIGFRIRPGWNCRRVGGTDHQKFARLGGNQRGAIVEQVIGDARRYARTSPCLALGRDKLGPHRAQRAPEIGCALRQTSQRRPEESTFRRAIVLRGPRRA